MTLWAVILFWVLLGLAVLQALSVIPFVRTLRRPPYAGIADNWYPKTAVILCLRGSDPFLAACLEAVLRQDYPCYDLHIIVDSLEDPAWETVRQVVARCGAANVHVSPLVDRREACSLKCSSLLQAVSELDASYEAIALLDADTVPHRTWLRELVAPLADDRVAATTGNRWYMPTRVSWGSLVRWVWNAAAAVEMYMFQIPWGGTLAVRMSVFREADLQERWAHAFGEDTMLHGVFRRLGYRVAFVPSLMMVNREDCTLASFFGWVRRQLVTARLNHSAWALVVGHGLAVSLAQGIAVVCLLITAASGHYAAAGWLLAGMGLYWSFMAGLLTAMEVSVRRTLAARSEPTNWLRASDLWRVAVAMPLTQMIYAVALLWAWGQREVSWRGIRYHVEGRGQIRMRGYEPFSGRSASDRTSESL